MTTKTDLVKTEFARSYARIADRHKDWMEKITTKHVAGYGLMTLEKLNTMNVARELNKKKIQITHYNYFSVDE